MGKRYTKEERCEALKLADEIGATAAARRLGINVDTLYGWRGREKERAAAVEAAVGGRSEEELVAENEALRQELRQARQIASRTRSSSYTSTPPLTSSPACVFWPPTRRSPPIPLPTS